MRDKTSFWFDEISFEQIRSDFNEVKHSYFAFTEHKIHNLGNLSESQSSQFDSYNFHCEEEQEERKIYLKSKFATPKRKENSKRKLTEEVEDFHSFKLGKDGDSSDDLNK